MADTEGSNIPSQEQVKSTLAPHLCDVWDAAAACLDDPSDERMGSFRQLCRPAELLLLLRAYATGKLKHR